MKIHIINGPNLNLLGSREPKIYGYQTFDDFFDELVVKYADIDLSYFQSNSEGELIDRIHEVGFAYHGIIINPGAFAHTSIALADALRAVKCPYIEVHISNIYNREAYRHHSYLSAHATGVITGLGLESYQLALDYFIMNDL
jgi:3-dehydroquinate dehydratase II